MPEFHANIPARGVEKRTFWRANRAGRDRHRAVRGALWRQGGYGLVVGRKILFITTDQMRFDAIGRERPEDRAHAATSMRWRQAGINYTRCHAQNVVCMPARATMITGQYVSTHGVWMNGVPLPEDAPSVARLLKEKKNYRTALIGKAHFEPFLDLQMQILRKPHGPARRVRTASRLRSHGIGGAWRASAHCTIRNG